MKNELKRLENSHDNNGYLLAVMNEWFYEVINQHTGEVTLVQSRRFPKAFRENANGFYVTRAVARYSHNSKIFERI